MQKEVCVRINVTRNVPTVSAVGTITVNKAPVSLRLRPRPPSAFPARPRFPEEQGTHVVTGHVVLRQHGPAPGGDAGRAVKETCVSGTHCQPVSPARLTETALPPRPESNPREGYIDGATTLLCMPAKNRPIRVMQLMVKNGWFHSDVRKDTCGESSAETSDPHLCTPHTRP